MPLPAFAPAFGTPSVGRLAGHVIGDGFRISTDLQPVDVPYEQALHLALIVNELVTNALKHAFPTGEGTVRVSTTASDHRISLRVADNGVGSDPAGRQGSGSRLLEALANGLGATLTRADGAGMAVAVSVPRN